MNLKIIGSKKEYQQYMKWVDEMFDKKVAPESKEGEELLILREEDILAIIK